MLRLSCGHVMGYIIYPGRPGPGEETNLLSSEKSLIRDNEGSSLLVDQKVLPFVNIPSRKS